MSILNFFKDSKNQKQSQQTKSIVPRNKSELMSKGPTLHEDLKDLIWIADGPYKNYKPESEVSSIITFDTFSIKISFLGKEEPSLIYTSQKINKPNDIYKVERPPYFPNYSESILTVFSSIISFFIWSLDGPTFS